MDKPSLLPINRSSNEHLLSQTLADASDLNGDELIRSLYNAQTCPVELLSYLAQAVAVDLWDHRWGEQQKRDVIENALEIHRLKGTPIAVLKALQSRGIHASLREWWQTPDPQWWLPVSENKPGTVVVETLLNDNQGVDKNKLQHMNNAIGHAKRHSIHCTLELGLKWDETLAFSLARSPSKMSSDRDCQMSPLHPLPVQSDLAIGGFRQAITLADFDFYGETS